MMRRRILAWNGLARAAALGQGMPARADIGVETPWHPVATAYRSMIFFSDLKPVVWDQIGATYDRPHPAAAISRPAKVYFENLKGNAAAAIDKAITASGRQHIPSACRSPAYAGPATLGI